MKKMLLAGLAVLTLLAAVGCKEETVTLKTKKDKLSYAIGMQYGKRVNGDLKRQQVDLDSVVAAAAIRDVMTNRALLLTDKEAQEIISAFQQEQRAQQEEKAKKEAEVNAKAGKDFLENNKKEEGVVELPSGLQYKIIKKGKGKKPKPGDNVECHYRGTLTDGKEFDSSYKRGQPFNFQVGGGVIAGWSEAVQLMREGAKWKLFIPSSLAYGNRAAGPLIEPGSTLIFDIELVKVQPGPGK